MQDSSQFIFVWNLIFITALLLVSDCQGGSDNYPDRWGEAKPCARKNRPIDYMGALCVPIAKDVWTRESEDNCKNSFKALCPEFNQAECVWYPWKPSDPSLNVKELQIPCCRLKYYAAKGLRGKYTWMEIHYTNQYGTSDRNYSVFDVLEINRFIKNHEAFGDCDQPDWPANALDPKGERGLPWAEVKNASKPFALNGSKICVNQKDEQELCSKRIKEYLIENFRDGFGEIKLPAGLGKDEVTAKTFSYKPGCYVAMIEGLRTEICRVMYVLDITYNYRWRSGFKVAHYIDSHYAEAQVYADPKGGKDALIRYAHFR
ncbi:hypothetical protein WDU94_010572 [Cyamophila willieti]